MDILIVNILRNLSRRKRVRSKDFFIFSSYNVYMLPREKFSIKGLDALSDVELIEILVGSGIKGYDFHKISRNILKALKQELEQESNLSLKTLSNIRGVGTVLAMRILSGIELGRRVYGIFNTEVIRITNASQAYEFLKDMSNLKRERVDIVCLNSRFEYILRETVAVGSVNRANILPRDILQPAISSNSSFVLLAHNHPSGDSTPSQEDVVLTERIKDSLELVGIQLLDHIVIGKRDFSSVPL